MDSKDNKINSLSLSGELENFKQIFLQKAAKKLSHTEGEKLWEQVVNSNAYTFNKAHAVAYGYLSYYFAFLKANYFPLLITYFLNKCLNSSEKTLTYLQEAVHLDFTIHKPDINFSEVNWTRREKNLFMGFASLKNFQLNFFEEIIAERKKKGRFRDWEDLITRTNSRWEKIDLSTFQKWIEVGLFESLRINTNDLLEYSEIIFRYCYLKQSFSATSRFLPPLDWPPKKKEDLDVNFLNKKEWENFGIYVSYFSIWKEKKKTFPIQSFAEIVAQAKKLNNQELTTKIYAIVQDIQVKRNFVCLFLYDLRSNNKLIVNHEFYQKNQTILLVHQAVVFHLLVSIDNAKVKNIKIEKVEV